MISLRFFRSCFCCLALCPTVAVLAQGTAITYHGRLSNNGSTASGSYDLTFSVFEAGAGTNQLGDTITNATVPVADGLFVVSLDFGPGIFTGPERWLEIGVRTNGGANFIKLSPRQVLTPTPYAIMANTASNLMGVLPASQLSGTLSNGQLPANVSQLESNQVFTGVVAINNPDSSFSGDGSGLDKVVAQRVESGSNVFRLAWYGDSILAGIDAETKNSLPVQVASLGWPYFANVQSITTNLGYGPVLSGLFPGGGSPIIADAMLDPTNAPYLGCTSIIMSGHNDGWSLAFPNPIITNQIAMNIARMVAALGHDNYLVLPVLKNLSWTNGTVEHRNVTNFNRYLSQVYSNNFLDYYPAMFAQAQDATDQAWTNRGSVPARLLYGEIHPNDLGHSILATNVFGALHRILNRAPLSGPTLLDLATRPSQRWVSTLSWAPPAYVGNMTAIHGGAMNFGGTMSGPYGFGIGAFIDGVKANSGSVGYSYHRIPHGLGWTNMQVNLLVSTDSSADGPGANFRLYWEAWCFDTNVLGPLSPTSESSTLTI